MPHSAIFKELSYVFIAAVIGGMLAWRLRQPLILGYVFAGILISPFTPGPAIHEAHTFELLAEVGVIFLMFTVGLEFSVKELLRVKGIALVGGPIGIVACGLMGLGAGALMGWGLMPGFAIGLVISVASTMVMSRLLIDRGELQSEHGRVMIAITLVEDLATVVMIIVLPLLANFTPSHLIALAKQLGLAALVLVPLIFLARYLVPRLLAVISRMCSDEIFLLVTIAVCLGAAAITQAVGLSLRHRSICRRPYYQRLGACPSRFGAADAFARCLRCALLCDGGYVDQPARHIRLHLGSIGYRRTGGRRQSCYLDCHHQGLWIFDADFSAGRDWANADR